MTIELQPDYRGFRCPGCNEVTRTDKPTCISCQRPISPEEGARLADLDDRIASAVDDARNCRHAAALMWLVFAAGFIPFLGMASYANYVLVFGPPTLLIRWVSRYGDLKTNPELKDAKRNLLIAAVLWIVALAAFVIILALGFAGAAARRSS
jgi:4-amino-4-deoxy-L-arabinose transferase-like glycosyltransferase